MLLGWREVREIDKLDDLRRTRTLAQLIFQTVPWKGNRVPDLREIMPLPGDPKTDAQKIAEEPEEERAKRWYKVARAMNIDWGDEKTKFIMKYWQPSWGPPL